MIVTLLTDFGSRDHYVGVMKGVVLASAPGVSLVDLGHEIAPGDVHAAAFALLAAYPHFPAETVHVAVVDPGVGTERRAIVVEAAGQRFVGPDNGLFSYLLDREPGARVLHVASDRYFLTPVSRTFHGRDVFAPTGAALARGVDPAELGPVVNDPLRLLPLAPRKGENGELLGRILHVDRFGNCVTNITAGDLEGGEGGIRLATGRYEIGTIRHSYAGGGAEAPFLVWGSSGFLEISLNGSSAADLLGLKSGDDVAVRRSEGEEVAARVPEEER